MSSKVLVQAQPAPAVTMVNCYALSQRTAEQKRPPSFETVEVNQGTALKTKAVSAIEHIYPSRDGKEARHVWNIFNVQNRQHKGHLTISVLERHPFTTQTFIPLAGEKDIAVYLVVIADDFNGKPDVSTLRAFLCKGDQAGIKPFVL